MKLSLRELIGLGLLDELARAFQEKEDARLLLEAIRYPAIQMPAFDEPLHFWSKVCRKIEAGLTEGGLSALVAAAAAARPGVPAFAPASRSSPPRRPPHRGAPLVFLAASQRDEAWTVMLEEHLAPFAMSGRLRVWSGNVDAGENRAERLHEALESAKVAVVLVSPSLTADAELTAHVVPHLFAMGVPVLPVPARRCVRAAVPRDLLALMPATPWDRPLESLVPSEWNAVISSVVEQVMDRLERLASAPSAPRTPGAGSPSEPTDVLRSIPQWATVGLMIPRTLIDFCAAAEPTATKGLRVVEEANELRRGLESRGAHVTVIKPSSLPQGAVKPDDFWAEVFWEARKHGSRMLGALLMQLPSMGALPARAETARQELLERLQAGE